MRIGLVVDSTCDLPESYYREYGIHILPVTLRLGDHTMIDRRDPAETLNFYAQELSSRGVDAETAAFSVEKIRELFLGRLVIDHDYVFCITVTAERSEIFANATNASLSILRDYRDIRNTAGVEGPFALRVVDSQSLFSGTGLMAAATVHAIRDGTPANDVRLMLDELATHVEAFLVPNDVYYIRERATKKGEYSVSAWQYTVARLLNIRPVIRCERAQTETVSRARGYEQAAEKLFDYARRHIASGLRTPIITISYGGDPEAISKLPGYEALAAAARAADVEILPSIMSAAAAVNVGGGALTLALAGTKKLQF